MYGYCFTYLFYGCSGFVTPSFLFERKKTSTSCFSFGGVINAAIFALAISFSSVDNWARSRDQDVVILTIYFPVVMPVVLLLGVLPEWVRSGISNNLMELVKLFGGSSAGEMLVIWTAVSGLALFEAAGLIGISRFFIRRRESTR